MFLKGLSFDLTRRSTNICYYHCYSLPLLPSGPPLSLQENPPFYKTLFGLWAPRETLSFLAKVPGKGGVSFALSSVTEILLWKLQICSVVASQ